MHRSGRTPWRRLGKILFGRGKPMSAIDGLHEAMARVADGFLALDASHRFTYANPRAVKLLGRGSESSSSAGTSGANFRK